MVKNKIRVLVVEDSKLYQVYLRRIIDSDPLLEIAGMAATGREALAAAKTLEPDVITLDLHLPDVSGFELLQTLVRSSRTPVIVVTSDPGACQDAIRLGARDFIEKLQNGTTRAAEQFSLLLKLKLKTQADSSRRPLRRLPTAPLPTADARERIIALGASLGGTEATLEVLKRLPDTLPGIVVVQHMPAGFTNAYAMRLDNNCALTVREAQNGEPVLPGTVLVAPGGKQMTVYRTERGYRVRCAEEAKQGGFCPSVDVLFRSVAAAAGSRAVGVILTGMGRDGAAGLRAMHDAGAYTLGQSAETCAVFGMPAAAQEAGGVDALLSPEELAETLTGRCSRSINREASV